MSSTPSYGQQLRRRFALVDGYRPTVTDRRLQASAKRQAGGGREGPGCIVKQRTFRVRGGRAMCVCNGSETTAAGGRRTSLPPCAPEDGAKKKKKAHVSRGTRAYIHTFQNKKRTRRQKISLAREGGRGLRTLRMLWFNVLCLGAASIGGLLLYRHEPKAGSLAISTYIYRLTCTVVWAK